MMGFECRAVYYSFVKDEPIPFHELTDVTVFGVWVVFEDLTRNRDVTSLVLRVNEIIVHDIVVELLTTRDIESEPTNFTTLFPCVGDVTVIFRASRCELDDVFTF